VFVFGASVFLPFDMGNVSTRFDFDRTSAVQMIPCCVQNNSSRRDWATSIWFSSCCRDAIEYVKMANGEPSSPPYQFRVVYPGLVRLLLWTERRAGVFGLMDPSRGLMDPYRQATTQLLGSETADAYGRCVVVLAHTRDHFAG